MYHFYVIQCQSSGLRYKGHTQDLDARIRQHNGGKTTTTKRGGPWCLVYSESFPDRAMAVERERYYKTYVGSRELSTRMESSLKVRG